MTVLNGIMMFSQYFSDFARHDAEGEILLVTSKGIYCRLGKHIVMVTDMSFGTTPICITITEMDFLTFFSWKSGQKVYLKDNTLHFPFCIIQLQMLSTALCPSPISLQPGLIRECVLRLKTLCKPKGVSSLCIHLLEPGNEPVIYPNSLCKVAHPILEALVKAMGICHAEGICSVAKQAIGMGIGLTPSLDDVILGMLYTLLRIAPDWESTQILKNAVLDIAPAGTNAISAAYLLAVAGGAPFGRLDDVLCGLSGGIPLNIIPILEIGSSSGSEMLLGLLLAVKMIYL